MPSLIQRDIDYLRRLVTDGSATPAEVGRAMELAASGVSRRTILSQVSEVARRRRAERNLRDLQARAAAISPYILPLPPAPPPPPPLPSLVGTVDERIQPGAVVLLLGHHKRLGLVQAVVREPSLCYQVWLYSGNNVGRLETVIPARDVHFLAASWSELAGPMQKVASTLDDTLHPMEDKATARQKRRILDLDDFDVERTD